MQQDQCTDCPLCVNGIYATGSLLVDLVNQRLFLATDGRISFADIGDFVSKRADLFVHASDILREKSRGLLLQNLAGNPYIDVQYGKYHKYRMFIVYVNGRRQSTISCVSFNKAKLPRAQKFCPLKEIVSVPLQQFVDEFRKTGAISISKRSHEGYDISIDERVGLAIIELIKCKHI